ncbi:MAG: DUF1684 domain-containing protein [Blastochloris sp.]|nr:DUF1684 domain-containing protein [Blastochloris sp.]
MTSDLAAFRARKNQFFAHDRQSPLTPDQQRMFTGLRYFPENPALRFELPIEPFAEQMSVVMQTTTGDQQTFVRYGRIHFTVDGHPAFLTIYRSAHGYFLPFADALAGDETYGAGRYLDPTPLADGRLHIDFNLAYNPYCAYNDAWSCPITPPENRLKLPIRAGEQVFHG